MSDKINPAHYLSATGLECHEAQRAMVGHDGMAAYWRATAVKYLWRYPRKGRAEDVRKAIRCLEYLLAEMEGQGHGTISADAVSGP